MYMYTENYNIYIMYCIFMNDLYIMYLYTECTQR